VHNFKNGDKVRVVKGYGTYPGWVGVEGVVEDADGWTLKVCLTTPATGDENPKPVGYVASLLPESVELIPEPQFKPGDIVEFWDEDNDHWQGGKGKVTANPSMTYDREGYVDVEILEEMPLNIIQKVGKVVAVPEGDLREYLEEWEKELLGWDVAPEPEPEPVKTCQFGYSWCDCPVKEEPAEEEAEITEAPVEAVNHPPHYGGDTTYETWKVAEAWGLDKDAYLFNVLKYISRAGKKGDIQEDLEKAESYLKRRIEHPLEV
jgi:hypothetical protein